MIDNGKLPVRRSIRLQGYDYSQNNAYFVTICTKDHLPLFGDVVDGKVILSLIGRIAVKCWLAIPEHHEIAQINEFVFMPNHMHGIIIINDQNIRRGVQLNAQSGQKGVFSNAPTNDYYSKISPGRNTLSLIIRTYKAAVTKLCRGDGIEYFCWQRNYYEHVIRNDSDLYRSRKYIRENPLKWDIDRENPVNL